MRVSQLIHAMDKGEYIAIINPNAPIGAERLYTGSAREGLSETIPLTKCTLAAFLQTMIKFVLQ